MHTRFSRLRRHGASASALLLWLVVGSCLNPRPDDLPAGAENGAGSNGTPVNDSARSMSPGPAPTVNAPTAPGAPAENGDSLFDATLAAPQDAGVPADAEPPASPSVDAGADANQ